MSPIETDRFRQELVTERKRVADALENLHAQEKQLLEEEVGEDSTAYDNHPGDTATVTFEREMEYTLEENSETVLKAIDAALKRIDEGSYGICRRCGREIAEERLEAVPWADLCIECKREVER
jgi:RNA polymerase-binding protein DksA